MLTGAHTEQSSLSNFLSLLKPKYTHSELTAYWLRKGMELQSTCAELYWGYVSPTLDRKEIHSS